MNMRGGESAKLFYQTSAAVC